MNSVHVICDSIRFYRLTFVSLAIFLLSINIQGQGLTKVSGRVTDQQTGEPLAFASLLFLGTDIGTTTDFEGNYKIETYKPVDSLRFSYIGYISQAKVVQKGKTQTIHFMVQADNKMLAGAFVSAKGNPAHSIIKKAQKNKTIYNINNLESYQYESFSKVQLAVNNLSEEMSNKGFLKKINHIFDTISYLNDDVSKEVLPVFVSENISDYYHIKTPERSKEIIKAHKIRGVGVDDGSFISQLMGSSFQQYNFNDNILPLLDKNFISPISDGSLLIYNYTLVKTEKKIGSPDWFMIQVEPKNPLDLVFTGTIWIEDSTFALRQISLEIRKEANLNYIEKIKIVQELEKVGDFSYLPSKMRVVMDIAELTKKSASMVALFSISKKNIQINNDKDLSFFEEPVIVLDSADKRSEEYWELHRHEKISDVDKRILSKIDTLTNVPIIKTYVEVVEFLVNGSKKVGKVDIGPYVFLYGWNVLEGSRIRLGMETNSDFSEKIILGGYLAYGTKDQEWKYKAKVETILNRKKWTTLGISRREDIEQIGVSDKNYSTSNLFTAISVFAASQLNKTIDNKMWFTSDFKKGWMMSSELQHKKLIFNPVREFNFAYIPDFNNPSVTSSQMTNATFSIALKYAPKEVYLKTGNTRIRKAEYNAYSITADYTRGFAGIMGSQFNYNKLSLTYQKSFSFGYIGNTNLTVIGTKIFERVPYPLLNVHRGNESFIHTPVFYNMMNFFEFVTDQDISFRAEHHFGGLFLNKIPLLKKLKWREYIECKGVWGQISQKNLDLIPQTDMEGRNVSQFYRLDNEPYIEYGYGITNIFKLIRVGMVHRATHLSNPRAQSSAFVVGLYFSF